MMDLSNVLADLKNQFCKSINKSILKLNYGLRECEGIIPPKSSDELMLEILFVENLHFISLTKKQQLQISSGNYKNLFSNDVFLDTLGKIKIKEKIEVINNTIINNNTYIEDSWSQIDF